MLSLGMLWLLLLSLLLQLLLLLLRSTSEDMDAKLRKITEVFGLNADPEVNDAPSFPELLQSIADLQRMASDCRDDIDQQNVRAKLDVNENAVFAVAQQCSPLYTDHSRSRW